MGKAIKKGISEATVLAYGSTWGVEGGVKPLGGS